VDFAKVYESVDTVPLGRRTYELTRQPGAMLDRAEALQQERLEEVFHISDHMVRADAPLRDYLNGAA